MLPVLFTVGSFPISSFGLFLVLAIILASFIIWRIVQVYDFNKELIFDLVFLTTIGGLIGGRIYYILFHLNQFNSLSKIFLINIYPGLSFWGSLLGGVIFLRFFCYRFKVPFTQIADYAIVGLFAGLILGHIGCLLGSCEYGMVTNLPIGVAQVGLIGKRFPLQIVEAVISLIILIYLWKKVLKFHFSGQILALGLVLLGVSKFFMEFFRGDKFFIFPNIILGQILSLVLILIGIYTYYYQSKRSFIKDLKLFFGIFVNSQRRQFVVLKMRKSWYNLKVKWRVGLISWHKKFARLFHIKSNPPKF